LQYAAYGRVFPDPHGCRKDTPGASPWAKGNVCAATFLGWEETLAGLRFLEKKFPRFAHLENLHELKKSVPEFASLDMQTAGLPKPDLTRDRKDLYVFVVTDSKSKVALADRKRFAYSLSIHGIERAGLEGGVRAAEDLITWASTAPDTRILEPSHSGPTAKRVLEDDVIYFILSNPDGWSRGDLSQAGAFYQRYNGNGTDLNREFPTTGYANPLYTPFAEPEAQGFAAYLKRERNGASAKRFAGTFDLHGMVQAPSFSYTLMPGGARDYESNHQVVSVARAVYADATSRLAWSPLIAPPESCPGKIPVIVPIAAGGAGTLPMCADQWGTTWDTINYSATNTIGDWMGSAAGLGSIGLSNEMAYSHLAPNNVFVPDLEQLHIDGNKGLIYSQLATLTEPTPAPPLPSGVAYAPAARRLSRAAGPPSPSPLLHPQAAFDHTEIAGEGFEFDVKGPPNGVHNGGIVVEMTAANAQGITPALAGGASLQRFGVAEPGEQPGWYDVGTTYAHGATYAEAGARIDVNNPLPGRYRIAPSSLVRALTKFHVTFPAAEPMPTPNAPYDIASTDVFRSMASVRAVTPASVLKNAAALDGVRSYVLADDAAPGVAPADRERWFGALKAFVQRGGNLVLTDHALDALVPLGIVPQKALTKGPHYAGWISFTDTDNQATYGRFPLTRGLSLPGAAESAVGDLEHARQTYDPAALGYVVSDSPIGDCSDGLCEAPQEVINVAAWKAAGGVVAGRSAVVLPNPGAGETHIGDATIYLNVAPLVSKGVTLGEVALGKGTIRIAGGLLPTATEANPHPFGLDAQALSWTGYQVLVNLMSTGAAPGSSVGGVTLIPRTGGDTSTTVDLAAIALAAALAMRALRRRSAA
jgi:hypothetical protein